MFAKQMTLASSKARTGSAKACRPRTRVKRLTWRGRGLSKSFISRVIIGVTPFRVLITLLISYLLSPLPLQVGAESVGWRASRAWVCGSWTQNSGFRVSPKP